MEEDDRLVISDVRITDIDVELATNYELAIRLSVDYGVVSLNDTEGLEFSFGDGVEDGVMSFHGPASSLGKALSCIIYRGNFNWWVGVQRGCWSMRFSLSPLRVYRNRCVFTDQNARPWFNQHVNDICWLSKLVP